MVDADLDGRPAQTPAASQARGPQPSTEISPEYTARAEGRSHRIWATPGAMAVALRPAHRTVARARGDRPRPVELVDTPDGRLIVSMPPQEGKSQRVTRRFPLWCLVKAPETRVVIASYELSITRRWGRAIRDDIV